MDSQFFFSLAKLEFLCCDSNQYHSSRSLNKDHQYGMFISYLACYLKTVFNLVSPHLSMCAYWVQRGYEPLILVLHS